MKRSGFKHYPRPELELWDIPEEPPSCWLAQFSRTPCDGRLVRVHLIPKQVIDRECPEATLRGLQSPVWDYRSWVYGCGGPTGIGGHHGALDGSRTLRIPREALPAELEAFAEEHGLGWWLDRTYGPRRRAA